MPAERINAAGMTPGPVPGANMGATRNSPPLSAEEQEANRQSDAVNVNKAQTNISNENFAAANQNVANIHDPATRFEMHSQLAAAGGSEYPPATLFRDGSGGLSDPLALFFMMVFYLDRAKPTFNWNDVLQTAKTEGGDNVQFGTIKVEDAFLPQRRFSDSNQTPQAITTSAGNTNPDTARELNTTQTDVGAKKDADPNPTAVSQGQGGGEKKGGNVVVWPTQTMPTISGGMNKTVDWPSKSVATWAEPMLAMNNGAGPIEIDVEFVYAVGTFGIGDGEMSGYSTNGDFDRGGEPADTSEPGLTQRQKGWWTVEEVMGAMYLATSLVYPFKSGPVVSQGVKDKESADTQAQFPVLFMRHYSLFPFLTPFVVKAVKIEPDEEQPLIVTEPLNLNKGMKSHLTFPAVRQVVKITLSMISAHYYLPVFGGKDEQNQMQIQTSGETYLALAKSLMGNRIKQ